MSFTLAVSFKYKTGGISRWIYLNFFQQTFPVVLRHIKVLREVNSSPLNPFQSGAEKWPQGDQEARSSSTLLLKAFSHGKPSIRSC